MNERVAFLSCFKGTLGKYCRGPAWVLCTCYIPLQDPREACPGVTGNITQYQISFQARSVVATENVNIAECTAGRCSHTFEPPSNPPSSYDSVSVAAENVVGVGATRTCTTQPISELISSSCILTGNIAPLCVAM